MKFLKVFVSVLTLGFAGQASAILFDFTDDYWQSSSSQTLGGITATVSAYNNKGSLTNYSSGQRFDGSDMSLCGLLACEIDGLGVKDDEISYSASGSFNKAERIRVTFSELVDIEYAVFLDLFAAGANRSDRNTESAKATGNTSSGNVVWDGVALGNTGWFLATETNRAHGSGSILGLDYVEFFTKNLNAASNSDFALAAVEVSAVDVSEPSIIALFGLGLIGLTLVRRREK